MKFFGLSLVNVSEKRDVFYMSRSTAVVARSFKGLGLFASSMVLR